MSSYSKTISTTASPEAAYAALTTGFEHWWTKPQGTFQYPGDKAKFGFPPGISYWTFEAVKLVPDFYVEMKCVDALHKHEGQTPEIETEWLDTRVTWLIGEKDGKTTIHIEHVGLIPELLCYDICVAGWDHFFGGSLQAYLDTGKGMPHKAS